MKAYKGFGNEAPLILNLDTRLRLVVNFTSRPIYLREKSSRYTLNRRLDGPRTGLDLMRRSRLLAHAGIRTPVRPARNLFTILPTYTGSPIVIFCEENVRRVRGIYFKNSPKVHIPFTNHHEFEL